MSIALNEILEKLGISSCGAPCEAIHISGVNAVGLANPDEITFISSVREQDVFEGLAKTKASCVICSDRVNLEKLGKAFPGKCIIGVDKPRRVFVQVIQAFFPPAPTTLDTERNMPFIHPSAKIGKNVFIGPFTYIGDQVEIGHNTFIGANCTIISRVSIGHDVRVGSNNVIGSEGKGSELIEGKRMVFPSFGGVLIDDEVLIGDSVTIDRGTFGDTEIACGVHMSSNVHISHNVRISEHCFIESGVMVSGSATIGKYSSIGAGSVIPNKADIGDHVLVMAGTVCQRKIPSGVTVGGNPSKIISR